MFKVIFQKINVTMNGIILRQLKTSDSGLHNVIFIEKTN